MTQTLFVKTQIYSIEGPCKAFYSSRPGCRPSGVRLIHFFFTNFNISSVFGIKDTLLSYNPSGLHSQTHRPGAVAVPLSHVLVHRCHEDQHVDVSCVLLGATRTRRILRCQSRHLMKASEVRIYHHIR